MALSKEKKVAVIEDIAQLLDSSKLTVVATYTGTTVKSMQALRADAKENGTKLRVVKNRLVKQALSGNDRFKQTDNSALHGQLLYAFNAVDEVAPAQVLANFAKTEPQLTFVGAITADGTFIGADDVKALAALPSKDQLRAQLIGTINAPLSGFVGVLSGNVRGVMNVLNARAQSLES